MPSPSLHVHYKLFNTTTTKSVPCNSTTSCAVCFPIQFNRTLQGSPVPYYNLNTCLANCAPDAVYPIIRLPVHLSQSSPQLSAFDIVYCLYGASSLVHLRSTQRIHTCGNRCFRFSLSLTTHSLRNTQHKVV
jgi:hypothetical protein